MIDYSKVPSDAAILKAVDTQRNSPFDCRELIEQYPDTYYQALDAASRLNNEPTSCELYNVEPCGGCLVPLD